MPCTDTIGKIRTFNSATRGYGLVYRVVNTGPIIIRGPILYWVERNTTAPFTLQDPQLSPWSLCDQL
ncbi:MAG: hypothetical protein R2867_05945 [Caldilineaceae bacterium]